MLTLELFPGISLCMVLSDMVKQFLLGPEGHIIRALQAKPPIIFGQCRVSPNMLHQRTLALEFPGTQMTWVVKVLPFALICCKIERSPTLPPLGIVTNLTIFVVDVSVNFCLGIDSTIPVFFVLIDEVV